MLDKLTQLKQLIIIRYVQRKRFNAAKIMLLGYLSVALAGTVLLMMPVSSQNGTDVIFLTALFTATSAISVTGLVVVDTVQTWSVFGRITILFLLQIGALGFMSFTVIFFFIMNRKIGLSQRLLIMQSINLHDIQGVIRLICHVLFGTFIFQIIMPRSAGFSVVSQGQLMGVTRMVIILLMLVGGSVGSSAGGIKNVTAGILFLSAVDFFKGKSSLSVFGRTIPASQIRSALAIALAMISVVILGSITIALIQPELPFSAVLFETTSAIATCGLSYGITDKLAPISQMIIILFMFCGRVGIMTLGMAAFLRRNTIEKTKYPDEWVMMG